MPEWVLAAVEVESASEIIRIGAAFGADAVIAPLDLFPLLARIAVEDERSYTLVAAHGAAPPRYLPAAVAAQSPPFRPAGHEVLADEEIASPAPRWSGDGRTADTHGWKKKRVSASFSRERTSPSRMRREHVAPACHT